MRGTASASAPATGGPSPAIPCHRDGKHRFGSLRPRRDQRHCRRRHWALDRTATAQQVPSGSDHIHSIYDTSAHRMRASISPPIRVTRTSCRQPQPYSRITRSCAVLTIQRSCIPRLRILLEPNSQGGWSPWAAAENQAYIAPDAICVRSLRQAPYQTRCVRHQALALPFGHGGRPACLSGVGRRPRRSMSRRRRVQLAGTASHRNGSGCCGRQGRQRCGRRPRGRRNPSDAGGRSPRRNACRRPSPVSAGRC